ncbi:hypothetical protein SAMD00023353_0600300 [Rosellinia necatrix]|uniref:Uncharacterized protein n=1 Tax=Rosellinia necatrix TaxID=77044 RepID=A0A1S8A5Y5_ROSNE|nr:hypothetical protein SAMD00023353_0600300 [Rosellinia necatrix]
MCCTVPQDIHRVTEPSPPCHTQRAAQQSRPLNSLPTNTGLPTGVPPTAKASSAGHHLGARFDRQNVSGSAVKRPCSMSS